MPTNIKFRKAHMTFVEGYFYMFDDDSDMLLQKTDDGITAFSFPFDTVLDSPVISCEYDGVNFWTLRTGTTVNTLFINRWRIDNYICKLQDTFVLASPDHKYNGLTFTIEHYHCNIDGVYGVGDRVITVKSDNGELPGWLQSGMDITIGPNSYGQIETVGVQQVLDNVITLTEGLKYSYIDGAPLLFYNHFWLFNNANGVDLTTGALYKFNAYSGSLIVKYAGGEYKDVKACTFTEIDHFINVGKCNSLLFVKATNLIFIDVSSDVSLRYYGSMVMDNIEDDKVKVIEIKAISVYKHNVYRLQLKATYYGSTETYDPTAMNYQAATFNPLAASIAMTALPNVIAANGVSTAQITTKVKDQFLQPLQGRIVYFTLQTSGSVPLNECGSIVGQGYQNTDSNGEAVVTYRSSTTALVVNIVARVNQV